MTGGARIEPRQVRVRRIDRTMVRLAFIGLLVIVMFTTLFSRLWYLQVLASDEFDSLARANRVRYVHSEPERGRILTRDGKVLVDNRFSLSVTIDRSVLEGVDRDGFLRRLARVLEVPVRQIQRRLEDVTVSPYKPVAVASDVPKRVAATLKERSDRFPGVGVEMLPVRHYPLGPWAAQVVGYVGEISQQQLELDYFAEAAPTYEAGDIVGKTGLERAWDRELRGRPRVERFVVDSSGKVVSELPPLRRARPGSDLVTWIDSRIQKATERALATGIRAARTDYEAPAGGAVVLDPTSGGIVALASFPTYDPAILADGISEREMQRLGMRTPDDPSDDALVDRTIQQAVPPGSTFKVVTAGAAMRHGVATRDSRLGCPGSKRYGSGAGMTFRNWTARDLGTMGFARSLEVSCDTFYYDLGWGLETRFGAALGDGTERFQRYARAAGLGAPTGVDLPAETAGRVPDAKWCDSVRSSTNGELCPYGWLPGYSVNLSIGQGDLIASPLQMAVTYAALVNGGKIVRPRVAAALTDPVTADEQRVLRPIKPRIVRKLPLGPGERAVLRRGLEDAVAGPSGTARGAFAGFPLARHPVAGKTGTAQIGALDSGLNYAWFVSYAPADDPRYVVAVYLEKAGHGGESAAPVARRIYEAIFGVTGSGTASAEGRSG